MSRRSITVQIPDTPDANRDSEVITFRDEISVIDVAGYDGPLLMAISETPGGEPLVTIPGNGSVTLYPQGLDLTLNEGTLYHADFWDARLPKEKGLLAQRLFRTRETIYPESVQFATQYVNGRKMVTLTAQEYHRIAEPDHRTTDYLIIGYGTVDPSNPPPDRTATYLSEVYEEGIYE